MKMISNTVEAASEECTKRKWRQRQRNALEENGDSVRGTRLKKAVATSKNTLEERGGSVRGTHPKNQWQRQNAPDEEEVSS
jgi:hypothetical protein